MKNVYTAFRYSPPAVGFAALVEGGGTISAGPNANVSTNNGNVNTDGTTGNAAARRAGSVLGSLGMAGVIGLIVTVGAAAVGL